MKNKYFVIILTVVFLAGAYLRFKGIYDGSFAFTYDVGRDLLAVAEMIESKKPILIGPTSGQEGVFYGPYWYYLLTIPFILSGGNPSIVALFIAIIGVLTMFAFFFLGRRIGEDFLGVTLFSYTAVSSSMINSSTQIWNPYVVPLLVTFSLFVLTKLFSKKEYSGRTWLLLGILFALTTEMEIVFGILFSSATIFFLVILFRKKILSQLRLLFLGIFLVELPRLLFELRHNFLMTRSFFNTLQHIPSRSQSVESIPHGESMVIYLKGIWLDTLTYKSDIAGILILVGVLAILFTTFRKLLPLERTFIFFIAITLGIFVIVLSFFPHDVWGHFLVGIPVLLILLVGICLNLLRRKFPRLFLAPVIAGILVIFAFNPIGFFSNFRKPLWEGDQAVYRNQLAVVDHIYSESQGKNFKYILYTGPIHDYTYKYLFSWYGKKTYNKIPQEKNADLFFLIIEPDENRKRINEWLKVREADGTIIGEKHMKGGILVQKRELKKG